MKNLGETFISKTNDSSQTQDHVIAFVSGKGGAGKSVIIANLGARLAKSGKKVLMIDCDFFTRGLTFYMIGDKPAKCGFLDFLRGDIDEQSIKDAIETYVKDYRTLSLFPASSQTTMYSVSDIDKNTNIDTSDRLVVLYHDFRKLLDIIRRDFDYIFIDTRSGVDPVSLFPALAADGFIMIVEEDKTSWRIGDLLLSEMRKVANLVSHDNEPKAKFKGFILNKVTEEIPKTFIQNYLEKRVIGGKCLLQISLERAVPMAFKDDKLVIEDSPSSMFAKKITVLRDIIMGQIEQERSEKKFAEKVLEFYGSSELLLAAFSFLIFIMGLVFIETTLPIVLQILYVSIVLPIAVFLVAGMIYRLYRSRKAD